MSEKKLFIGLPLALILGASAIAIGVVPGVRDWIDQAVPWLGLNGPKGKSLATVPSESAMENDLKRNDFPPQQQLSPPLFDVQLAQANLPVPAETDAQESVDGNTAIMGKRLAQTPSFSTVPPSGLPVPSSTKGKLMAQGAKVFFPDPITVAADADGKITKMLVDNGTVVQEGILIMEIDSRLAEKEVVVAQEELKAANLKAKDDSQILYSKAAQKVAEQDVKMSNDLISKGAENMMDNQKKRLELEKAGLQVSVSQTEKKREESDVEVKNAKLEAAKVQLALRRLLAMKSGMISGLDEKHQFDWVRAGEPICKLTSMDRIRIKGTVQVSDAPHLLLNAPARVTIFYASGKGETLEGSVGYVSPRATNIDEYPIHVDLPNRLTEDGQYLFREGMQADIEITPRSR